MKRIFIAGDIVPQNRCEELFENKKTAEIFGGFLDIIKKSDYSIVNLEAPIHSSDPQKRILKSGPHLHASPNVVDTLQHAGIKMCTLANNHFRDYGDDGVENTLSECNKSNIKTIGGGRNITEAKRIGYIDIDDTKFAFINACENEFSIATENHGGSNPIDIIDISNDILEANKNSDYVVLILHGGVEGYNLPTPRMKKWYRHFIDCGADAVVNHHQHCYSGYEIYKGKPIFYGLGNFCFDWNERSDRLWNTGIAITLMFDKDNIDFEIHSYEQCTHKPGIRLLEKPFDLTDLNKIISDDKELQNRFKSLCESKKTETIFKFLPFKNRIFSSLFYRGWLGNVFNPEKIRHIKNAMSCESHLEVSISVFSDLINKQQ